MGHERDVDESPFQITFLSASKGLGWVATRSIDEGAVLLEESPRVCAQLLHNQDYFPACDHCLRSMESPAEMLCRLAGTEEVLSMSPLPGLAPLASDTVPRSPCLQCQRVIYCSDACRQSAWQSYHRWCCVGSADSDGAEFHPIMLAEMTWKSHHYPPETATVSLLVKMLAMIRAACECADIEDPISLFDAWYAPTLQGDSGLKILQERKLDGIVEVVRSLLGQAFNHPRMSRALTPEGFMRLFCVIACNSQGIGTSALDAYLDTCVDPFKEGKELESIEDRLEHWRELVDEHSAPFLRAEGAGLYAHSSKINHSCVPNAKIIFPKNNSIVQVIACRPIQAGEEITISYLEEEDCPCESGYDDISLDHPSEPGRVMAEDREIRQLWLRDYFGFMCNCELCTAQLRAGDHDALTSSGSGTDSQ